MAALLMTALKRGYQVMEGKEEPGRKRPATYEEFLEVCMPAASNYKNSVVMRVSSGSGDIRENWLVKRKDYTLLKRYYHDEKNDFFFEESTGGLMIEENISWDELVDDVIEDMYEIYAIAAVIHSFEDHSVHVERAADALEEEEEPGEPRKATQEEKEEEEEGSDGESGSSKEEDE